MTKVIDFYFDFISPYSYLAYEKLKILNKKHELNINFKPILLGGLHKLGNITAPAFNKRKMKNMMSDCALIAKKNGIKFRWNTKFPLNTLSLMRGYLIINNDIQKRYLDYFFYSYWRDNKDISKKDIINKILDKIGLDIEDFFNNINSQHIKDKLKKLTNDAFIEDIFGAPTFVVNKKIFWGQDRLDYAIEEFYN